MVQGAPTLPGCSRFQPSPRTIHRAAFRSVEPEMISLKVEMKIGRGRSLFTRAPSIFAHTTIFFHPGLSQKNLGFDCLNLGC